MPLIIHSDAEETIGLDELVERLVERKLDTTDTESMLEAGDLLKKLGNNRTFLGDIALEELKGRTGLDNFDKSYGPQVMMLVPPDDGDRGFFIRANFWPSERDHVTRASGTRPFAYHQPHDHSFNFLTVGYFGPGYSSNYYEYDYAATAGYPGEPVDLRFIEKAELTLGKVMLYRAFVDVHDQLPPTSMSISLNIMESSPRGLLFDQYGFDTSSRTVREIINPLPSTVLMPLLASVGDEDGLDYLSEVAKGPGKDRIRFAALRAVAGSRPTLAGAREILERGLSDRSRLVSGWSAFELERLNAVSG
jgi:hypothetical protein